MLSRGFCSISCASDHLQIPKPRRPVTGLAKVECVAGEIAAEYFFKRPGEWCSYYDYLPVCLGDEQRIRETLVQVAPHP